jgi:hypothetical protein
MCRRKTLRGKTKRMDGGRDRGKGTIREVKAVAKLFAHTICRRCRRHHGRSKSRGEESGKGNRGKSIDRGKITFSQPNPTQPPPPPFPKKKHCRLTRNIEIREPTQTAFERHISPPSSITIRSPSVVLRKEVRECVVGLDRGTAVRQLATHLLGRGHGGRSHVAGRIRHNEACSTLALPAAVTAAKTTEYGKGRTGTGGERVGGPGWVEG